MKAKSPDNNMTATGRFRLLFVSPGNSVRSLIASAFAVRKKNHDIDIYCATLDGKDIPSEVAGVLAEVDIPEADIPRVHLLAELTIQAFDAVVFVGERSEGVMPILPGTPEAVYWEIPRQNFSALSEKDRALALRKLRDEIRERVDSFLSGGYLAAFVTIHRKYEAILNHISEGLLAHDMQQRIVYFNKAAEAITGYSRTEVLNRRCSDVFPGGLCGGKCLFQEPKAPLDAVITNRPVDIINHSGERRNTITTINPMLSSTGQPDGIVISFRDITREHDLARRVGENEPYCGIIGRDPKILAIFDLIRDLADSNAPVLIQGDSGTGKELVARAIHSEGRRAGHLFVPVNCGALPEGLLESELFGHVRGAFTGAFRDKKGRFELADGGTIFLDEIGDISPAMQVKLLRVLQEGCFERVGSEKTITVDVRVVSATNKNLMEEIAAKRFRDDLYYRLSVVPLTLPPLAERRGDIPAIADHILRRAVQNAHREPVALAPESLDILVSYSWPGNIRELENWLQYALLKCKGAVIEPQHLPPPQLWVDSSARQTFIGRDFLPFKKTPRAARQKLSGDTVRAALARCHNNRMEAARLLGVSRATLYRFLDSQMPGDTKK